VWAPVARRTHQRRLTARETASRADRCAGCRIALHYTYRPTAIAISRRAFRRRARSASRLGQRYRLLAPLIAQSLELEIIIQDEVSNYRPHPFDFFRRWHFPDLLRAAARVGNRMYGDCYGAVSLVAGAPFRRDELAAQFVSERHHSLPCPGVPFAAGKIGITLTFLAPHCVHTKCRCWGTSYWVPSLS
jgi:hypothetical protein